MKKKISVGLLFFLCGGFLYAQQKANKPTAPETVEAEQPTTPPPSESAPPVSVKKGETEKSISVHLMGKFQLIGDLGSNQKSKIYRIKDDKLLSRYSDVGKKADVLFAFQDFHFGLEGSYGILTMSAQSKIKTVKLENMVVLHSMQARLNFMPEVDLAMGYLVIPIRSEQQSPYATLGIANGFYAGTGEEISSSAGFILHGVVKKLFEYSFGLLNGYQSSHPSAFHVAHAPLMAMQMRFHVFGQAGDNSHYHFDGRNSIQVGGSFAWQHISQKPYYAFGNAKPFEHLLHWDVFMSVEFALAKNSLLLDVLFEGLGNNPFRNGLGSHTQIYNRFGRLSAGMGFYVSSIKLMPSFRYGFDIERNNSDLTYIESSSNHLMEVALAYFPFADRLNFKFSYLAHYTIQKNIGYDRLPYMTYNHKTTLHQQLLFQVQFVI